MEVISVLPCLWLSSRLSADACGWCNCGDSIILERFWNVAVAEDSSTDGWACTMLQCKWFLVIPCLCYHLSLGCCPDWKLGRTQNLGLKQHVCFVCGRHKCGKNIGGGFILRGAEIRVVRVGVSLKSFHPERWHLPLPLGWNCRFLIELYGCLLFN